VPYEWLKRYRRRVAGIPNMTGMPSKPRSARLLPSTPWTMRLRRPGWTDEELLSEDAKGQRFVKEWGDLTSDPNYLRDPYGDRVRRPGATGSIMDLLPWETRQERARDLSQDWWSRADTIQGEIVPPLSSVTPDVPISGLDPTPPPLGFMDAGEEQGWLARDQDNFPIDLRRPIVEDRETGQLQTERSMGVYGSELLEFVDRLNVDPTRMYNIPSIWHGRAYDVNREGDMREARRLAAEHMRDTGWVYPNYTSAEEANAAAPLRSQAITIARKDELEKLESMFSLVRRDREPPVPGVSDGDFFLTDPAPTPRRPMDRMEDLRPEVIGRPPVTPAIPPVDSTPRTREFPDVVSPTPIPLDPDVSPGLAPGSVSAHLAENWTTNPEDHWNQNWDEPFEFKNDNRILRYGDRNINAGMNDEDQAGWLERGLNTPDKRTGKTYRELVREALAEVNGNFNTNIPEEVAFALFNQESHYDPDAVELQTQKDGTKIQISRGLGQVSKGAASDVSNHPRANMDVGWDDLFDPETNIRAALSYLAIKLQEDGIDGRYDLAFQAYNGGAGNVKRGSVSDEAEVYSERMARRVRRQLAVAEADRAQRAEVPGAGLEPEPEERIILPEDQERDFQKWWGSIAEREGYNPDPDLKEHYYDYRKAWLDGVRGPGEDGHWPSDYKDYDHPNVVVGGFHTQTLERVHVIPGITVEDLVREGWGIDNAERFGVEYGLPRGRLSDRAQRAEVPGAGLEPAIDEPRSQIEHWGVQRFPADTDDVIQAAEGNVRAKYIADRRRVEANRPEGVPGLLEETMRTWDLIGRAAGGFIELLGETFDIDSAREAGGALRRRKQTKLDTEYRRMLESDHAMGSIRGFAEYVRNQTPQVLWMAPGAASGIAGMKIGARIGAVGGPKGAALGAGIGGTIGYFLGGITIGTGNIQAQMKERDPSASDPGLVWLGGTAVAALDTLTPFGIGRALTRRFGNEVAESLATRLLLKPVKQNWLVRGAKGGALGMATEGLTEGLQESVEEYVSAGATDRALLKSPNVDEIRHAFKEGAWGGGVLGFLGGGFAGGVRNIEREKAEHAARGLAQDYVNLRNQVADPNTAAAARSEAADKMVDYEVLLNGLELSGGFDLRSLGLGIDIGSTGKKALQMVGEENLALFEDALDAHKSGDQEKVDSLRKQLVGLFEEKYRQFAAGRDYELSVSERGGVFRVVDEAKGFVLPRSFETEQAAQAWINDATTAVEELRTPPIIDAADSILRRTEDAEIDARTEDTLDQLTGKRTTDPSDDTRRPGEGATVRQGVSDAIASIEEGGDFEQKDSLVRQLKSLVGREVKAAEDAEAVEDTGAVWEGSRGFTMSQSLRDRGLALAQAQVRLDKTIRWAQEQREYELSVEASFVGGPAEGSRTRRQMGLMIGASEADIQALQAVSDQMSSKLKADGFEVADLLGRDYQEGMEVIASGEPLPDDTLEVGREVITRIKKPAVNYQGQIIQAAEVEISQGTKEVEGDTEDKSKPITVLPPESWSDTDPLWADSELDVGFNTDDFGPSVKALFDPLIARAKKGDRDAQWELAKKYKSEGFGTKKDLDKARELILRAAKQGHVKAQRALGDMQFKNIGRFTSPFEQVLSLNQAVYWYRLAANNGQVDAQYVLGQIYAEPEEEWALDQDLKEAARWYRLAADQGHVLAKKALERMEAETPAPATGKTEDIEDIPLKSLKDAPTARTLTTRNLQEILAKREAAAQKKRVDTSGSLGGQEVHDADTEVIQRVLNARGYGKTPPGEPTSSEPAKGAATTAVDETNRKNQDLYKALVKAGEGVTSDENTWKTITVDDVKYTITGTPSHSETRETIDGKLEVSGSSRMAVDVAGTPMMMYVKTKNGDITEMRWIGIVEDTDSILQKQAEEWDKWDKEEAQEEQAKAQAEQEAQEKQAKAQAEQEAQEKAYREGRVLRFLDDPDALHTAENRHEVTSIIKEMSGEGFEIVTDENFPRDPAEIEETEALIKEARAAADDEIDEGFRTVQEAGATARDGGHDELADVLDDFGDLLNDETSADEALKLTNKILDVGLPALEGAFEARGFPVDGGADLPEALVAKLDAFKTAVKGRASVGEIDAIAQDAAVALANRDVETFRGKLEQLREILRAGPEKWVTHAENRQKQARSSDVRTDSEPLDDTQSKDGERVGEERDVVPDGQSDSEEVQGRAVDASRTGTEPGSGRGTGKTNVAVSGGHGASSGVSPSGGGNTTINAADDLDKHVKPDARWKQQIKAIKVLEKLKRTGASPTSEDRASLLRYTGWGHKDLQDRLDERNKDFERNKREIVELFGKEEGEARFREFEKSSLAANFTSRVVMKAIYKALDRFGFKGGNILEPSLGIGHFFGNMPDAMARESMLVGSELDKTSGEIARMLYPNATIEIGDFGDSSVLADSQDVAVGNPPFGQGLPVGWEKLPTLPGLPREAPKKKQQKVTGVHNAFLFHTLSMIRPGGIVAFVTSRYGLDNQSSLMRDELEKQAKFLGAIRLPAGVFSESGGTGITPDIVFFQKREVGDETPSLFDGQWQNAKAFKGSFVNEYFLEHPEMVIGELGVGSGSWSEREVTVQEKREFKDEEGHLDPQARDRQYAKDLEDRVERLPADIYTAQEQETRTPDPDLGQSYEHDSQQLRDRVPVESYYLSPEGVLYQRHVDDGKLHVAKFTGKFAAQDEKRVRALIPLMNSLDEQLRLESSPDASEGEIENARKGLNHLYENIIAKFPVGKGDVGPNRLHTQRMKGAIGWDDMLIRVLGLETYDEKRQVLTKADILSKRVAYPDEADPIVRTPLEALTVSESRKSKVDIDFMSTLLPSMSREEIVGALKDTMIFEVPATEIEEVEAVQSSAVPNDVSWEYAVPKIDPAMAKPDATKMPRKMRATYTPTIEDAEAWQASKGLQKATFFSKVLPGSEGIWDRVRIEPAPSVHWRFRDTSDRPDFVWYRDSKSGLTDTAKDNITQEIVDNYKSLLRGKARAEHETVVAREAREKRLSDPSIYVSRDEYLSGDVKTKLEEAKAAQKVVGGKRYLENIKALEEIQPEDVPPKTIREAVRMMETWIPPRVIQDFINREVLGKTNLDDPTGWGVSVKFVPATSLFEMEVLEALTSKHGSDQMREMNISMGSQKKRRRRPLSGAASMKDSEFTKPMSAVELMELSIRGKKPVINYRRESATGERAQYAIDVESTSLAQARQDVLERKFQLYVTDESNPDGRKALAEYNKRFNRTVNRTFDGSHLTMPGSARDLTLRPHQANAIWRILTSGSTLLAHEMGAGKTFAMIGTVMEWKRLGLARKPMMVVPNHLVGSIARDFYKMYPNAKILVATKTNFDKQKRRSFINKIATTEWDAVIIAHSHFEAIPISDKHLADYIAAEIEQLRAVNKQLFEKGGLGESESSKQIQRRIHRLHVEQERLREGVRKRKDPVYPFESLGVDALVVDEAHKFKNLYFFTRQSRVKGIPQSDAKRAMDMFLKVQHVQKQSNNRLVVFATGTPISNTLAEMYTMQRYMQLPLLQKMGIGTFDAWSSIFGEIAGEYEQSIGKGYKKEDRFRRVRHNKNLSGLFRLFADVQTQEDLNLPVPKVRTGKWQVQKVPRSDVFLQFLNHASSRAAHMPADKSKDNMLKLTSELRKASLDMRLLSDEVLRKADINPSDVEAQSERGKIAEAAENIARIYKESAAEKGTQLAFMDIGVPQIKEVIDEATGEVVETTVLTDEDAIIDAGPGETPASQKKVSFSAYAELKKQLIDRGVKAGEIAFIHDYDKTPDQKESLYDDVREGRVRVLIGSTEKMGAGMNVQDRAVALHHLDVPWRPSDIKQRDGRIVRQGNIFQAANPEGFEVDLWTYAIEKNLFDEFMWQMQAQKMSLIDAALKGEQDIVEDEKSFQFTPQQVQMIAASDPNVVALLKVNEQIRMLQPRIDDALDQASDARRKVETIPAQIEDQELIIAETEIAVNAARTPGYEFSGVSIVGDLEIDETGVGVPDIRTESTQAAMKAAQKTEDDVSVPDAASGGSAQNITFPGQVLGKAPAWGNAVIKQLRAWSKILEQSQRGSVENIPVGVLRGTEDGKAMPPLYVYADMLAIDGPVRWWRLDSYLESDGELIPVRATQISPEREGATLAQTLTVYKKDYELRLSREKEKLDGLKRELDLAKERVENAPDTSGMEAELEELMSEAATLEATLASSSRSPLEEAIDDAVAGGPLPGGPSVVGFPTAGMSEEGASPVPPGDPPLRAAMTAAERKADKEARAKEQAVQTAERNVREQVRRRAKKRTGILKDRPDPPVIDVDVDRLSEEQRLSSIWKILKELTDSVSGRRIALIKATHMGGAAGSYERFRGILRMQGKYWGDLRVLLHEIGHAMDLEILKMSDSEELAKLAAKHFHKDSRASEFNAGVLDDELMRLGHATSQAPGEDREGNPIREGTPEYQRGEGMAEFISGWLVSPDIMAEKAPALTALFKALADDNHKLIKPLLKAQSGLQAYITSSSMSRILSKIRFASDKREYGGKTSPVSSFLKLMGRSGLNSQSLKSYLNLLFNDDLYRLWEMEVALNGDAIDPGMSLYWQFRLLKGTPGQAESCLEKGPRNAEGRTFSRGLYEILTPVQKAGVYDVFSAYLVARRAVRYHKEKLISGFDLADAESVVRQYEESTDEVSRVVQEAAKGWDEFTDGFRDYLQSRGNLPATTRKKIEERWGGAYAPFHRLGLAARMLENTGAGGVVGAIPQSGQAAVRRIKQRPGSLTDLAYEALEVQEPIGALVQDVFQQVQATETNNAMNRLIDLSKLEHTGEWLINVPVPPKLAMRLNLSELKKPLLAALEKQKANGVKVFIPKSVLDDPEFMNEIVNVWRPHTFIDPNTKERYITALGKNGKRRWAKVEDDGLWDSIAKGEPQEVHQFIRFLRPFARLKRATATLNLPFMVGNIERDFQTAKLYSPAGMSLRNLVGGWASVLTRDESWAVFEASRAGQAAFVSQDVNLMSRHLRRLGQGKIRKFLDYTIMHPIDGLRAFREMTEVATRLGAAKRDLAKRIGVRKLSQMHPDQDTNLDYAFTEAMLQNMAIVGRESTQDFAKAGKIVRDWNQVTAFLSAKVGGWTRLGEEVRSPRKLLRRRLPVYFALTTAIWFLNQDEEEYDTISADERRLYHHIPVWSLAQRMAEALARSLGKTQAEVTAAGLEARREAQKRIGPFVRFRRAFEFGEGSAVLEAFLNWKVKDDPNWKATLPFGETGGPFDAATEMVLSLSPDFFVPVWEVGSNYDYFRDRPIVSPTMLVGPNEQRLLYNRWTSETSKWIGSKINYSPAKLDHYIYGYFTGVGRMAVKQLDRLQALAKKDGTASLRTAGDIPFGELGVRAMYGGYAPGRSNLDEFYRAYESLNGTAGSVRSLYRSGETDEAFALAREYGLRISRSKSGRISVTSPDLRRLNTGVSALRRTRSRLLEIDRMQNASPIALKAMRDDIVLQQVNIARRALGLDPLSRPTPTSIFNSLAGVRISGEGVKRSYGYR
jgi:N12 class adenine-specific DNA methylase/TPR repeat protein